MSTISKLRSLGWNTKGVQGVGVPFSKLDPPMEYCTILLAMRFDLVSDIQSQKKITGEHVSSSKNWLADMTPMLKLNKY